MDRGLTFEFSRHAGLPDAAGGAHAPAGRGDVPRPRLPPTRGGGRPDPGVVRPLAQEAGRGGERAPGKSHLLRLLSFEFVAVKITPI